MKPALSALSLLALSSALAAQALAPSPNLAIGLTADHVEFRVSGPKGPFLGAVVLSFSPQLSHYLVGIPPILSDFAVLGVGVGDEEFRVTLLQSQVPPGIAIYAQGLVFDGVSVGASEVGAFVLDGGPSATK